jgi:hypothetical protein
MQHTPDSPSAAFGDLLASALGRSIETSLTSLDALRDAVQAYTRNEKHKGASLDSVMRAIASLLIEAEDDRASPDEPPTRDPKLARQLRAWCSEHYTALE